MIRHAQNPGSRFVVRTKGTARRYPRARSASVQSKAHCSKPGKPRCPHATSRPDDQGYHVQNVVFSSDRCMYGDPEFRLKGGRISSLPGRFQCRESCLGCWGWLPRVEVGWLHVVQGELGSHASRTCCRDPRSQETERIRYTYGVPMCFLSDMSRCGDPVFW